MQESEGVLCMRVSFRIALAGQAMDEILKEEVIKGTFPAEKVDEIKKAVGTYIARVPERAAEKDKDEGKKKDD